MGRDKDKETYNKNQKDIKKMSLVSKMSHIKHAQIRYNNTLINI